MNDFGFFVLLFHCWFCNGCDVVGFESVGGVVEECDGGVYGGGVPLV